LTVQVAGTDREAIWVALLAHLRTTLASQFNTIGRRLPAELSEGQQPALFLVQTGETRSQQPYGTGGELTLHGRLIVYLMDKSGSAPPGKETAVVVTQLNAKLKAIDEAFGADNYTGADPVFTIGGVVNHCWIEGDTDIDPGWIDQQAAAIIPVHAIVP
jgi:hypothetical protein